MITKNKTRIYNISAELQPVDKELIKVYMIGAINSFCNENADGFFSSYSLWTQ